MLKKNSEQIKVSIADYKTSKSPDMLITLGLGSCIGICIIDAVTKVGGLAHIMLPYQKDFSYKSGTNELKFADSAIPLMIADILKLGGKRENLVAKIVGGSNMFPDLTPDKDGVGYKNQIATKETLKELNIKIVAEELGGNIGRTIIFDLNTGLVTIKSGKSLKDI